MPSELDLIQRLHAKSMRTSQKLVSQHLHISQSYLSEILSGKKGIGDDLAQAMGYCRKIVFEKIKP